MTGYDSSEQEGFLRRLGGDEVPRAIEGALKQEYGRKEALAEPAAFLRRLGIEIPSGIDVGVEERDLSERDLRLPGLSDLVDLERLPPARWICITFCFPRRRDVFYLERCIRFCFIG